jgi:hypothetical protein
MGNRLSSKQHGNDTDLNPKLLFSALLNLTREAHISDAKSPHLNSHKYSFNSHFQHDRIPDTKIHSFYSQMSLTTQASLSRLFIKLKQPYLAKSLAQQKVQQLNQAFHETRHTELCFWTLLHSSDIYSPISSSPTQNPLTQTKTLPAVLSPALAIL